MDKNKTNCISLEELIEIHLLCDNDFLPLLSSRVNIPEYCEKLYNNAELITEYNNQELIGVIGMYCNDLINRIAYISTVCVHPMARGRKTGQKLMTNAIQVANAKSMKKIRLEVAVNNHKAISLYMKNNFIKTETLRKNFYMEYVMI